METNIDVQSVWSRMITHWQPAVLVTACLAGGLTLTTMVIGSAPDVVVQASEAAIEETPVDMPAPDVPIVTEAPVDTTSPTDAAEVVDVAAPDAVAPVPAAVSAASLEPATAAAPAPSAAAPAPAPPAAPTTAAPAPAPVATTPPVAPVIAAGPRATAAPTTAAPITTAPPATQPAPTTAAPAPTTAATPPITATTAAALTYPSFSAGSAATVVLQFDGSSIYVASLARQPNWVAQIDKNGPRTVEIKFFNTATQQDQEFHATVEGGRIKVEN